MENNGFGTQDILTGRELGLGGFGGYSYGQFASPASNAVRINRNAQLAEANERCTKETVNAGLDRISAQNFEGRFNAALNTLRDGQFQAELRNGDRLRDLDKSITDARFESKDCCCETQKEILRLDANNNLKFADLSKQQAVDNGLVTARLSAIEAKIDANKEIGELRAQLQTQQIFATCGCGCGGGVTPCPPPAG